jgi:hypothetical protein
MECSVHPPSEFICRHWTCLLPDWSAPVRSILVVLQPVQMELTHRTSETELHKQQLREQFLQFGLQLVETLQALGHSAEVFDPRTGFPLLSQAGLLPLDDVAVVRSSLGYGAMKFGACSTIVHPEWGSAVYPSILMSSAETGTVASLVGRLECHHSFKG